MPDLAERIAALSPDKRIELARKLQERQQVKRGDHILPRSQADQPYLLSFAQERIWFIHQLLPNSPLYNLSRAVYLTGPLDIAALEKSFDRVVQRQAALRTVFKAVEGRPVQLVVPHQPSFAAMPVTDLRSIPEDERAAKLQQILSEDSRCPFDLEHGPLIRAQIVRLAEEEHVMSLTMHHLATDGWSAGVFIQEMTAFYSAFTNGHSALSLPELPIQYIDYALWQREWLQSKVRDEQLAYWKEHLTGMPEVLTLPSDHPRPAALSYRGAILIDTLSASLTSTIKQIAQQQGATLFMVLLAAFKVLLYRLSGQTDVVVGTPIAGRQQAELEGLIGLFVNTLVLRTDLSGNPTFPELLAQVKAVTLGAYAHQDLPFEELVEALRPQRDLSHTPLVQVVFVLQNMQLPHVEFVRQISDTHAGVSKFDLTFEVTEQRNGSMRVMIEYNTDLFAATTIERWLGHYRTLLEGLAADPRQHIWDLPLLTATECDHLLGQWNTANVHYAPGECIHQIVEAQVSHRADAVAVAFEDRRLTYQALNAQANQLAHFLQASGVGRETRVGMYLDRSAEMVISMLGILKAGGVYVPLDTAYPVERLAFMLEDARPPVLLTFSHLKNLLPEYDGHLVCLDTDWADIARQRTDDLENVNAPDDVAYVIYTSGSTGKPKGVQVTHYNVARLFQATDAWFHFSEQDVWTMFHSYAFDFSVWEIWGALFYGGRVVVLPYGVSRSPEETYDLLVKEQVTVFNQTPSAFRQFIQTEDVSEMSPRLNLRLVIFGGEALDLPSLRPWFERHGDQKPQLVNMYGITETTVHVTYRPLTWKDVDASGSLIGVPIPDLQLYLLDARQRPVPIGVAGEIFVGGGGVVRGYLNRPELTSERFPADPFSTLPGARLYRSGDLGRYTSDGELEYLGRIDHQVKIRGFRIELGEIETVLGQHPAVREVVVLAREDEPGDKRLVAYLTPQAGEAPGVSDLRSFAKDRLPEYMLPAAFMLLEALPLTPHGKVDRRALPKPETSRPELETEYVAPRSEVEQQIAAIWREVLGVERVGVEDNFFDLGGHSLLVVQVHERLRATFGVDLPLTDLFKYTTVAGQARRMMPTAEQADEAVDRGRMRATARREALRTQSLEIAIIGLTGRFPGADDVEQFWTNVRDGVESIQVFSDEELLAAGIDPGLLSRADYVKAKPIVSEADRFDAPFFGLNPREAEVMDPQQRVFLECAWQALESAGYDPAQYAGRIGLYAGASLNTYVLNHVYPDWSNVEAVGILQIMISNEKDFLATHTSYKLNLKGPSVTVQTACSTSLVAVHAACQSLLNGECDMALAGGVSLRVPQVEGYLYEPSSIASPDGHCRPFDARARGTVFGNGVGVVVLKRLADALQDGDSIQAVIKGTAVNNDGAAKIGYTAPSEDGQVEVISEALALAGVEPDSIGYVEAHGTATALGDPIEVAALTRAFRAGTPNTGYCGLGSVKSNVGHLDAAAGMAGLIKTVQALKHRQLPPSLHFTEPNPKIDFTYSPFYVNAQLREWARQNGTPRRAGVSAFGIGGTNAHVVLEEAPPGSPADPGRSQQLLVLSAKTAEALERATHNLAAHLRQHSDLNLADAAYTLQVGRRPFEHRRALVCSNVEDAAQALEVHDPKRVMTSAEPARHLPVAFMFPGVGDHYVGMGCALYHTEPVFRQWVDNCAELLAPELSLDLRDVLYPQLDADVSRPVAANNGSALRRMLGRENRGDESPLQQTRLAQPAVFVIEYALAQLLMTWGIQPHAVIGYSLGEYVAACLAGVLSLADALHLVAQRAQLIQALEPGAMLAVTLSEAEIQPYLTPDVAIAGILTPSACVVSGPVKVIGSLRHQLEAEKVVYRLLPTSHAFHSPMMQPIVDKFAAVLDTVTLNPPQIPYLSNLTGMWITDAEATDPAYWTRHLCQTVRFAAGLEQLLRDQNQLLLEVGPGSALGSFVKQHPAFSNDQQLLVLSTLPYLYDNQPADVAMLNTLGKLWLAGAPIDWAGFYQAETRHRIPLPTYPFARERYWLEAQPTRRSAPLLTGKRSSVAEWFYMPTWKSSVIPAPRIAPAVSLIFSDGTSLSAELSARLQAAGHIVSVVQAGSHWDRLDAHTYTIDPQQAQDYAKVLTELDQPPDHIVYWATDKFDFYGLTFLAQALGHQNLTGLQLNIITHRAQQVAGDETVDPEQALVLGLGLVIPQEYSGLICRNVDVVAPQHAWQAAQLRDNLLAEVTGDAPERVVAYRGARRWVQAFEALPPSGNGYSWLREDGVYLITGGLGQIGRRLARYLAETVQARLVLTSRSGLPDRAEWANWLAQHEAGDATSEGIRLVQELEANGAEVLVVAADVAEREQMRAVIAQAQERFGGLHGVVHAAGIPREATMLPIPEMTKAACEVQFRPKVAGVQVLTEVLNGYELDFCLLCSSLSSVLGGLGFGAYAAANRYLDAVAQRQNRIQPTAWLSVNWDAWWFQEAGQEGRGTGFGASMAEVAMLPEEGVQAFAQALSLARAGQAIVSTSDLSARWERWVARLTTALNAEAGAGRAGQHARPNLPTAYVAPENDIEENLVNIWEHLLGITGIGIHDNFFELGGHSLLATQVMSKVRDTFGVELSMRIFFGMPTVAELALVIVQQQLGDQADEQDLAALLAKVEGLSDDDLRRLAMEGER